MKLEIDLNEILSNEYGGVDTLAEGVRKDVTAKLTAMVAEGIQAQIKKEVAKVLSEELQAAVKEQMPALLQDLMNAEYRSVDRYGDRAKEMTTFRQELVKTITEQMHYKKGSYSSDKNAFTKAVDEVVSENIKLMQQSFDEQIIEIFQKEAFEYAMKEMAKKLQVKL